MLGTDEQKNTQAFSVNPIILYESHADPITVDLIRFQLQELVEAGYTGICLEQSEGDLEKSIEELKFRAQNFDVVIEDIDSGKNSIISEFARNTYGENALAVERQFKAGFEHKILLYQAILDFQKENSGFPKIYGIDTGVAIETIDDMNELAEIYRTNDFDNPNFNLIRDREFARNITHIAPKHDGGIIIIMGADHFGLHKQLSNHLTSEQLNQVKSHYHFSLDGPMLGSGKHGQGLRAGDESAIKRYSLGIEVHNYAKIAQLEQSDYKRMADDIKENANKKARRKF